MNKIDAVKQLLKTAQNEAARFPDKVSGLRVAESKAVRLLQYEYQRLLEQIMSKGDAYDESRRFTAVDELLGKFPDNYESGELTPIMTVEEADDASLDKAWFEVDENDRKADRLIKRGQPKKRSVPKPKLKLRF